MKKDTAMKKNTVEKAWITKAGLRAIVVKNAGLGKAEKATARKFWPYLMELPTLDGWYCGYVGVPKNHPAFGCFYEDVDVDVHGGLTFSQSSKTVSSVDESFASDEELWWFGYDCAHAYDNIAHEDFLYNVNECESLARQLMEIHNNKTLAQ